MLHNIISIVDKIIKKYKKTSKVFFMKLNKDKNVPLTVIKKIGRLVYKILNYVSIIFLNCSNLNRVLGYSIIWLEL